MCRLQRCCVVLFGGPRSSSSTSCGYVQHVESPSRARRGTTFSYSNAAATSEQRRAYA